MTYTTEKAAALIKEGKFKELVLGSNEFQWVDKVWGPGHSITLSLRFLLDYLQTHQEDKDLAKDFSTFIKQLVEDTSIDELTNTYNWLTVIRLYLIYSSKSGFWPMDKDEIRDIIINKIQSLHVDIIVKYDIVKWVGYFREYLQLPEWEDIWGEDSKSEPFES